MEFILSRATESALELRDLLRLLAHLTASDLGKHAFESARPFTEPNELTLHRKRFEEARRLVSASPLVPYIERPLAPLLDALERGGHGLAGRDLVEFGTLLDTAQRAGERIRDAELACEGLEQRAAELPDCRDLLRKLRKTFDARGEIRENASPRLAELRQRTRRARQQIYERLKSLTAEHRDLLGEDTIPMRGGRLMLMVQAGARSQLQGLVHGRSSTGKNLYFEPLDTVESNNQLQQSVEDEAAEKRRILAEVVQALRSALPDLLAHAQFVAELDFLQACCRYAERCRGRLADIAPRHTLQLCEARHPLLDPELSELRREALGNPGHEAPIVPLDLELSTERRALVITGPNAGGKTVALKTLGLFALCNQYGLPIPAAKGSRVPFLSSVLATIGDDQDMLADRSTFSGRLQRLKEAWEAAGPDALILLDELGSGTDPDEGAALATAIFEGLVDRQCLLLITTHLSQVAAAALETAGAFCGAMLFDDEQGRPTYRLMPGPPGGSEALALARRMGLPASWIRRAETLLGPEHRDLRRLLAEIERARKDLSEAQGRLDTELEDAERLRRRLTEQEATLAAERKALAKNLRRELETFREETSRRLRDEVERLQRELKQGRRKRLAAEATQRIFEDAPRFDDTEEVTGGDVTPGDRVRHRLLGWEGTLQKVHRGRAQVKTQGKSLTCRVEDLMPSGEPRATQPKKKRPSQPSPAYSGPSQAEESTARELHLIGQRVEPALENLDRFLDRALLSSSGSIRIVHGHGTGRLRDAVREFLRRHPAVAAHRPGEAGEGGNGATVVDLETR